MQNKKLTGYILIALGLLHFIGVYDMIDISGSSLLILLLLILGLTGTITSISQNKHVTLFVSTIVFLAAIYLFVTEHYVILNKSMIILPAVLFMGGAGFIMLFIDNTHERIFLIAGSFLMLLSLFFVFVFNKGAVAGYANSLVLYVLDFWPGVLIITGFLLLSGRYK